MKALVDLTPTHRGGFPVRPDHEISVSFEDACEYVESLGAQPFTKTEVFRACWSAPATRQLIRFFLALDFIERISEPGARPVYYRVTPHAMPKAGAA